MFEEKKRKRKRKPLLRFTDEYERKEAIILRDHLAMQRTKLANERTLLAYTRSALYLIIGGMAFLGMKNLDEIRNIGYFALVSSAVLLLIGILRYYQLHKQLKQMYRPLDKELAEHCEEALREQEEREHT